MLIFIIYRNLNYILRMFCVSVLYDFCDEYCVDFDSFLLKVLVSLVRRYGNNNNKWFCFCEFVVCFEVELFFC